MNLLWIAAVFMYIAYDATGFKCRVALPSWKRETDWPYCPNTSHFCVCYELGKIAECSSQGKNLSSIPKLPRYVKELKFERNFLRNLTTHTFKNLINLNLTCLSLSSNEIRRVSEGAFAQLRYLKTLDLSNNMDLNKTEALVAIAETEVENLNISGNSRYIFRLPVLKKLEKLDLSYSNIQLNNKISPFCDMCNDKISKSKVPNLISLYLNNNKIRSITRNTFKCLEKVKYLQLSNNPIQTLSDNTFHPIKSLTTLHLKYLYDLEKIENEVFANSTFETLTFSTTRKSFVEHIKQGGNLFRTCTVLKILDLSGVIPKKQLNKIFKPLISLTKLYLRDVGFKNMPVYVFYKLPQLEALYLDRNKIQTWTGSDVFGSMTSLKTLHLDDNKISVVSKDLFTKQLLKWLTKISLSHNPLQCTCQNKWFRDFVREHNGKDTKFIGFDSYLCQDKSAFKDFNPTEDDCKLIDYVLISIVSVSTILVLFLLTSGIVYRMRWHIRYRLYLIRNYKNGYQKISSGSNSKYGAYVIYSSADKDRVWVHKELIPRLEQRHKIKLCIRMRDFAAGGVIMDAMVESLKQSNKVILVLSNNFARCDWCKFQLTLLHDRLIAEGRSILLMVNLETLYMDNMNDYLHWLITTNMSYDWSKEEVGKRLFWEQLVTALNLPNGNQGLDMQDEDIPNPMTQRFVTRLCTIL